MMTQIGVDLESIARLEAALRRTPGFARRVFTAAEQDYCRARGRPAQHYAARFCAKEAVAKALEMPVRWLEIEIINGASGAPAVRVSGATAKKLGRRRVALSLVHAGDLALATALVE